MVPVTCEKMVGCSSASSPSAFVGLGGDLTVGTSGGRKLEAADLDDAWLRDGRALGREIIDSWPSDAATEGELLPALKGEGARGKALAVAPPPASLPSEATCSTI